MASEAPPSLQAVRVEAFRYRPLDLKKTSIRIVEVLQSSDENDEVMHCRIRHVSVDSDYTCLSYVWGPTSPSHTIMLNGKPFMVRQNLWKFLKVASSRSAKDSNLGLGSSRTTRLFTQTTSAIWIDALCINQENTTERNHQVQQMGKIFSNALCVVAWLGTNLHMSALSGAVRYGWHRDPEITAEFHELCDSTYWKRAWITQEVKLARYVYLAANSNIIFLNELLEWLDVNEDASTSYPLDSPTHWTLLINSVENSDKPTLMETICRFRLKECSDRRDLVYSLLAISCDGGRVKVDYDISITQLSRDILHLYEQEACVWRVMTVLHALRIPEETTAYLDHHDAELDSPFVEAQALRLLHQTDVCYSCSAVIDLEPFVAWLCLSESSNCTRLMNVLFSKRGKPPSRVEARQPQYTLEGIYLHCLKCSHSRKSRLSEEYESSTRPGHLILAQVKHIGESSYQEWLCAWLANGVVKGISKGATVIGTSKDDLRATVHLSPHAICQLAKYGAWEEDYYAANRFLHATSQPDRGTKQIPRWKLLPLAAPNDELQTDAST